MRNQQQKDWSQKVIPGVKDQKPTVKMSFHNINHKIQYMNLCTEGNQQTEKLDEDFEKDKEFIKENMKGNRSFDQVRNDAKEVLQRMVEHYRQQDVEKQQTQFEQKEAQPPPVMIPVTQPQIDASQMTKQLDLQKNAPRPPTPVSERIAVAGAKENASKQPTKLLEERLRTKYARKLEDYREEMEDHEKIQGKFKKLLEECNERKASVEKQYHDKVEDHLNALSERAAGARQAIDELEAARDAREGEAKAHFLDIMQLMDW